MKDRTLRHLIRYLQHRAELIVAGYDPDEEIDRTKNCALSVRHGGMIDRVGGRSGAKRKPAAHELSSD